MFRGGICWEPAPSGINKPKKINSDKGVIKTAHKVEFVVMITLSAKLPLEK